MKNDRIYLKHIPGAINKVEQYIQVGYDEYMARSHWQDAVMRQLEIIGEATKRLSKDLRAQSPEVPWRRIAGLRDVLTVSTPCSGRIYSLVTYLLSVVTCHLFRLLTSLARRSLGEGCLLFAPCSLPSAPRSMIQALRSLPAILLEGQVEYRMSYLLKGGLSFSLRVGSLDL